MSVKDEIQRELDGLASDINNVSEMTENNTSMLIDGVVIGKKPSTMTTDDFKTDPDPIDLEFTYMRECSVIVGSHTKEEELMIELMKNQLPPEDVDRIVNEFKKAKVKLGY